MTDMAHTLAIVPASPVAELRRRQPALAAVGVAFLMLAAVSAALSTVDGRTLYADVSVWAKPAKFFLSGGLLMLTSAWFFGFVRPERREARALRWSVRVLIATAVFELAYITFQAAQGEASHYNRSDLLHQAMFVLMGVAAVAMLATKIPLALEISRRPVAGLAPALKSAVVLGLWMTVVLGTLTGMYLGAQTGHSVGADGGAAPIFGWNRLGGDLRVAHFFGMHAEQILPVVAALAGAILGRRWMRPAALTVAAAILATTLFVFVQATMGRPFLAW